MREDGLKRMETRKVDEGGWKERKRRYLEHVLVLLHHVFLQVALRHEDLVAVLALEEGGVVWCGVVWCGVVWCGVVWCGVVWCGVVWCGVVWCGVVWCGVVWCGVVWCSVVWCGVVWYGVV